MLTLKEIKALTSKSFIEKEQAILKKQKEDEEQIRLDNLVNMANNKINVTIYVNNEIINAAKNGLNYFTYSFGGKADKEILDFLVDKFKEFKPTKDYKIEQECLNYDTGLYKDYMADVLVFSW